MTQPLAQSDQAFLAEPRIGVLINTRPDGRPLGVPVWFDWDGRAVQMFTAEGTPKTRRIERDPWASLLVTNRLGEPEHWVAFDGPVVLEAGTGFELAERLAGIYWDLQDPDRAAALEQWRAHRDVFCRMTLTPDTIRSGS